MKILLYGINYSPELTGIGKYSGEMMPWFRLHGHEVRVITAPPYYPEWEIHNGYNNRYSCLDEGGVKVYRCPLYVPQKLSASNRLIHLKSFMFSSFVPLMRQRKWRPDVIIAVAPTLLCVPGTVLLSKLTGARKILHIQDFEIDAMLGLGLVNKGALSRLALIFERWCYNHIDFLSSISYSMVNKAIAKGVPEDKVWFFPNWSEVERFAAVTVDDASKVKASLNIPAEKKVVLYAGNIGQKQGLETVITVANEMQESDLLFLFVGQGGGKAVLAKRAAELRLNNVVFAPLQPCDKLPAMLKMADCHLVIQKRGAADAVLPSKLTNILAVGGNAVITSESETELGQLCSSNPGIAVCVEPESSEALKLGIEACLSLPKPNEKAQQYARKFLDKDNILKTFIRNISIAHNGTS